MFGNPFFRLSPAKVTHRTFLILSLGLVLGVVYRYCWLGKQVVTDAGRRALKSLREGFEVLFPVLTQLIRLDAQDPYKCGALLNHGQWLDTPDKSYFKPPFQNWQPPGCLMREYNARDLKVCLKSRRALYIGDSTTRQIFWATAKKLDRVAAEKAIRDAEKQAGHRFTRADVNLEFIWDPFLNSTELQDELLVFRNHAQAVDGRTSNHTDAAALILVGAGLWHARHLEANPLNSFKDAVNNIIPFMKSNISEISAGAVQDSLIRTHQTGDLLLLAPVQIPLYESLSPSRAASIVPEKIEGMNEYLRQLSTSQGVDVVWSYSCMTSGENLAYEESGLHVVESVASGKADVLLNLRCNAEALTSSEYPFDRTCCSSYRRLGWVQLVVLVWGLGVFPLVALMGNRGGHSPVLDKFGGMLTIVSGRTRAFKLPSSTHSHALLTFSLAICYCFYADRTRFFNKSQKSYSLRQFVGFCLSTLALGVLSIRRSVQVTGLEGSQQSNQRISDQPFLPRDQTDEWKGWMQLIILIYHYTGASKVLEIYEIVRLMVASYLFMTGFGHTVFFYQKGDYSLRRVALVLVRLNLLSCILPYVMRTDYLFYYFAPLVTFWFVVIYLTMRIGESHNHSTGFLLAKIMTSTLLVNALVRVPGALEATFFVLRRTCRIHWDATEWRFRVSLDIFIVYVGMLCGILYVKSLERHRVHAFFNTTQHRIFYVRITLVLLTLAVIGGFWALARRAPDKYEYNRWHPYVSCLPILSFVFLRNADQRLRNFHSSIFAWLGRCSLETFTLQFHIWLAADTKGLLSTGIFGKSGTRSSGRREDFVLLTAIFLWVSWCVARTTGILTVWLVDAGETKHEGILEGSQNAELETFIDTRQRNGNSHPNGRVGTTEGRKARGTVSSISAFIQGSLPARVGVLLGIMWLANVVSLPCILPNYRSTIFNRAPLSQTYT